MAPSLRSSDWFSHYAVETLGRALGRRRRFISKRQTMRSASGDAGLRSTEAEVEDRVRSRTVTEKSLLIRELAFARASVKA